MLCVLVIRTPEGTGSPRSVHSAELEQAHTVALQLLAPGAVVCHPEWPVPLVARFAARVLVLEPPIPVLQGQQVCHWPVISPHPHAAGPDCALCTLALMAAQVGRVRPSAQRVRLTMKLSRAGSGFRTQFSCDAAVQLLCAV